MSDIDKLQVKHLVSGEWVTESTNRTVDTENYTISVDVTSLSPFIAASVSETSGGDDEGDEGDSGGGSAGGSSGGGCFISASASEAGISSVLIGLCVIGLIFGLRLVLRSGRMPRHDIQ